MLRITTLFAGLLLAAFAQAERIDNFVLLDQHGDAHNLYYHKDKSAIVVMIQGNGCGAAAGCNGSFCGEPGVA